MINCFIFDLDGVIVDTARFHYLAWKEIANELKIEFDETENERLKGVSRKESLEILLQNTNTEISDREFTALMDKKNWIYIDFVQQMNSSDIIPGVLETLNFIKNLNFKTALASASKNAQLVIDKIGLNAVFDVIVDGNAAVQPKPSPEIFLMAAQKLNAKPENCVVIEDSAAGIEAAISANMKCIGIGKPEFLGHADFVFNGFNEITIDFLNELIK